jgi:DNA-binding response OmpR family regulator
MSGRPPADAPRLSGSRAPEIAMTWPQYLRGECVHRGWRVRLHRLEAELLLLLLLRRGEAVSMSEAAEFLAASGEPSRESLRLHLHRLAAKLPRLIRTLPGHFRMIAAEGAA